MPLPASQRRDFIAPQILLTDLSNGTYSLVRVVSPHPPFTLSFMWRPTYLTSRERRNECSRNERIQVDTLYSRKHEPAICSALQRQPFRTERISAKRASPDVRGLGEAVGKLQGS